MKLSGNGLKHLAELEGFRSKPYLDIAGVPTIGYGNTYYEDGTKVKMTDSPITGERGKELLLNIVKGFERAVNINVISKINQNQYDALVSFAYNVGVVAFKKSTLLKKVNINPNDIAIKSEFLRWVNAGGKKSEGLKNRRKEEIKLYFK